MNYIELINQFWKVDEEYSFTPIEVAVFFRLLNKCNAIAWKNPFNFLSEELMLKSRCKKDAFDTARNRLKQAGLIDYRNGNGRGIATIYEIRVLIKGGLKQHPLTAPFPYPLTAPFPPHNNKLKKNINKTSSISIEDRERDFVAKLKSFENNYSFETISAFKNHWTEKNEGGKKMRFEMQPVFELSKRLATWFRNEKSYAKKEGNYGTTKHHTIDKPTFSEAGAKFLEGLNG